MNVNRLEEGSKVPDFTNIDINSRNISSEDLLGKTTLFCFFRFVSCPFCNLWIHGLLNNHEIWNRDLNVVGVFHSKTEDIKEYVESRNSLLGRKMTIISDADKKLYKVFGIESSFLGVVKAMVFKPHKVIKAMAMGFLPKKIDGGIETLPADFIIGPDGKIIKAHYGSDISDHITYNDILKAIDGRE